MSWFDRFKKNKQEGKSDATTDQSSADTLNNAPAAHDHPHGQEKAEIKPAVTPEIIPEAAPILQDALAADSPAEAPAKISADIPAKIPAEIPAETPAEIPVQQPQEIEEAPVNRVIEVPVEKPLEIPAEEILAEKKPVATEQQPAEQETPVQSQEAPVKNEAKQEASDTDQAKKGWFKRMKEGLKRSTQNISTGISDIFTKRKLDDEMLEELEDLLITADLGVAVAAKLAAAVGDGRYDKEISGEDVKTVMADEIEKILTPVAKPLTIDRAKKPHVILMAGVNGAGKTTTIGKLAKQYTDQGLSVMLAAGDTFRAAAVEQLVVWGDRVGVPVVTKDLGADAAALAYEALDKAITAGVDVLLIDTAGRLQNREELMAELAKVVRVIGKKIPEAPHDTVIVLDASTGQNAVHQVEVFQKIANISGIVMTKLDGSARGGVLVACADKFKLPVHAIGVGEAIEDLAAFDPKDFARAIVGLSE